MMVAEAWVSPLSRLARYVRADEMQQAFNFEYLSAPWDAAAIRAVVDSSIAVNAGVGAPTTWVLSNHDVVRHASRFGLADLSVRPHGNGAEDEQPDPVLGLRRARAATLLMLGLPGSAYLYQGEELGLPEHTAVDDDLRQDPTWVRSGHIERGRDGCRVPIPWEADAPGLGFGPTGRTWLPQPDSYAALARDRQAGVAGSTLELYRSALRLRRELDLSSGALEWADADDATGSVSTGAGAATGVLRFVNSGLTVLANLGAEPLALPTGEVLLTSEASGPSASGLLPPDTTVWLCS
jgi:alpha-glucosidase